MVGLGIRVFGLGAIALGLVGLAWADFAGVWQPVPDGTPERTALAYAAALLFLLAGTGLQWRRTLPAGAVILTLLYLIFAALWVPRVIGFPSLIGTWLGVAEQIALAVGGVVAYASVQSSGIARTLQLARGSQLVFGLCLIVFGLSHFLAAKEAANFVPKWIPPGQYFWALATGVFHVLAGVALLANIRALLAARLLTLMFIGFQLLVWMPQIFLNPSTHMVWAASAVNLCLVGAAWAVADSIARFGAGRDSTESAGTSSPSSTEAMSQPTEPH